MSGFVGDHTTASSASEELQGAISALGYSLLDFYGLRWLGNWPRSTVTKYLDLPRYGQRDTDG